VHNCIIVIHGRKAARVPPNDRTLGCRQAQALARDDLQAEPNRRRARSSPRRRWRIPARSQRQARGMARGRAVTGESLRDRSTTGPLLTIRSHEGNRSKYDVSDTRPGEKAPRPQPNGNPRHAWRFAFIVVRPTTAVTTWALANHARRGPRTPHPSLLQVALRDRRSDPLGPRTGSRAWHPLHAKRH
jgi:hypothetical protein